MVTAMSNIVPSHMMDRKLFDFEHMKGLAYDNAQGDILFDRDETLDQFQNTMTID